MNKILASLGIILIFIANAVLARDLKPGFEKQEYLSMLAHFSRHSDSIASNRNFPLAEGEKLIYRSGEVGLDNKWFLWVNADSVITISIRGTVATKASWAENSYTAMTAATGTIRLGSDFLFDYHLAEHPRAAVHTGWLIGMAFLARDILPHLDSLLALGYHNVIITGHSQGGALSYLLTSHLHYLQQSNRLPSNLIIKTYCSAAPKPGNLFYAYDYEHITAGGWAFNVVNSADWVPELPSTTQTASDLNETNPIPMVNGMIHKQNRVKRIFAKKFFKKLTRPSNEQVANNEKILGKRVSEQIAKFLPGFDPPPMAGTMNYVRTGTTIVLYADTEYFRLFPEKSDKTWLHHTTNSYWYLANRLKN